MSLKLAHSLPSITAKTWGLPGQQVVYVGEYEIPFKDFFSLAYYVLTNTDLEGSEDPRRQFVESIKAMAEVPGYMVDITGQDDGSRRLDTDVEPVRK